jgi:hypothetical protein
MADGRVVGATGDNEHSDLFYGMPWSQGTIGLLVSAEIKLVHIKECHLHSRQGQLEGNRAGLCRLFPSEQRRW